jgi:hypothetical protein
MYFGMPLLSATVALVSGGVTGASKTTFFTV